MIRLLSLVFAVLLAAFWLALAQEVVTRLRRRRRRHQGDQPRPDRLALSILAR
jgi:hypothetical protein